MTRPTQQCHFEWSWVILSELAKYSMTQSVARSLCDSWASCFPYKTAWQYSDRDPPSYPNGGVECRWCMLKYLLSTISGFAIDNCCTVVSLSHFTAMFLLTAIIVRPNATRYNQSRSFVTAYSARPTKRGLALCTVTVVRESYVWLSARLDVRPKTTEQNWIVRTGKSET